MVKIKHERSNIIINSIKTFKIVHIKNRPKRQKKRMAPSKGKSPRTQSRFGIPSRAEAKESKWSGEMQRAGSMGWSSDRKQQCRDSGARGRHTGPHNSPANTDSQGLYW